MRKIVLALCIVILLVFSFKGYGFAEVVWQDISRGILDVQSVLVNPDNPNIIYIGTSRGIYKSENGGQVWRNILSIGGENKKVNFLLFDPQNKNYLYAATGNGLFYSPNQGKNWSRTFRGKNAFENECTGLAILPYGIYLGTKAGVFLSKNKGRSWCKEPGIFGNSQILNIAYNLSEPNYIYIASLNGVFKTSDAGKSWEKIFVAHSVENTDQNNEAIKDQDEPAQFSDIKYINIDPNNLNCLYVATAKGVYRSQNKGKSWDWLTDYGLLSKEVKFLLMSFKSTIYAVTKSGIFEYTEERWHELSLRLTTEEIRFLAQDNQGNLYAASERGLFKANVKDTLGSSKNSTLELYYKDEPKISEVQQAAIKYAEVEPEKIIKWRKQAARRAWLPKITIDMDRDKKRTISKSIWGIYSSYSNGNETAPGRYYIGPDDETRYNNTNWGVSLTWELGDLIFSDDQTNIDVRSRLMVQLRDDILDEVTKTYFERLRVKMELDNLSIEDRKKRFEKELRLQELTASLDALTGGYFSQHLKN